MKTRLLFIAAISSAIAVACSSATTEVPGGGNGPAPKQGSGGTTPGGGTGGGTGTGTGGGTTGGGTTGGGTTGGGTGTMTGTETWNDGKMITASLDIMAGATVTIAPGANVTVADGVTITVHGTLSASSKASHSHLKGSSWSGIVVASGGTLDFTGVDIDGAGIQANGSNKAAKYDYGTMTGGQFTVDAMGTITTDHAAIVNGGGSQVTGNFTATYMDYAGAAMDIEGAANASIADSKITGTGGDFFTANGGTLFHIEYSVVTGTHCPFHFNTITQYTMDHVATRMNGFGPMLYNMDPGPNKVSYCSFEDPNWDQTGAQDEVDVDNTYIKNKSTAGIVKITTPASGPVTAAAPRGTPGPNG
jgi:hypothetical protein